MIAIQGNDPSMFSDLFISDWAVAEGTMRSKETSAVDI
jgi:hypothetical protein